MDRLTLLIAYAAEAGQQPFRPGRHDCALFAAGWVKLVTGRDFARGWRSTYRSLRRGQQLLEEAGFTDHLAFAAAHLPEIAPAFAQVGDLAVLETQAFGIVAGEIVYCLRPEGLGLVPRSAMRRAFNVGRD
ncbi:DUF6950 family protein [Yoonia sp.]|uniref:DUF6950 family protein n=1 Tax=Yoonia sp. TaxID=2212373 RepID=UPI002E0362E1|nr:hypothetical protein [Yoonia sp.]